VIVAARIRLLAALQTATHHVGGWSAVIDERLPDNHQAAERRQALAGRPPVGMVAIPPPLPSPDQDSPLGRSEQALWDRGCRFPDCRDHVFGKLPWIWHDDVVAGVIRTLAGIIARAQARGGVAPGDPRPSRLFPDGHHGDGHAVLRGLRRAGKAEMPKSLSLKSGSQRTLRWRETDSNRWSLAERPGLGRVSQKSVDR
jgi:hypothetical protein